MIAPPKTRAFVADARRRARAQRHIAVRPSPFAYDGNQTRHAVVEDGTPTYFLWDGPRLLETRNADYSLKCRFTHVAPPASGMVDGIGTCVEACRASDGKRFYMLYDHRGSAHAVLDESKTVIATRLYSAFGELVSESGTWPAEVPFGYQTDWLYLTNLADGSPLYLSPTRVYHAGVGRFLQRDLRRTPGENLYVYARNNPVNMVDPMGLQPEQCLWSLGSLTDEELKGFLEQKLRDLAKAVDPTSEEFAKAFRAVAMAFGEFRERGKTVVASPMMDDAALAKGFDKWETIELAMLKMVPPRGKSRRPSAAHEGSLKRFSAWDDVVDLENAILKQRYLEAAHAYADEMRKATFKISQDRWVELTKLVLAKSPRESIEAHEKRFKEFKDSPEYRAEEAWGEATSMLFVESTWVAEREISGASLSASMSMWSSALGGPGRDPLSITVVAAMTSGSAPGQDVPWPGEEKYFSESGVFT